jgi:uncharacterized cupredoxin-like copper-binding protein
MTRRWIAMLVGGSLLAVSACSGGSAHEVEQAPPAASTNLAIEVQEFHFSPSVVAVPAGEEVTVTVANSGTLKHEWVVIAKGHELDDQHKFSESAVLFEVDDIANGTQRTSTFTIAQPGRYQLICAIEGHFDAGMHASLVVV